MNQDLQYKSKSFQVFMPEVETVKTVTVSQLATDAEDTETPITKVEMPIEHGFFRGVEYTETNTLLEYAGKKWEKLTTIVFKDGGKDMFGTDTIRKIGRLTKIDKSVRNAVLTAAELPTAA
ncbi:MAG: hypothetical protein Q3996_02205 [Candidatus Saccharibacteria bacterium]|nr:hypothetical protein [Candidatus Saccharibacteria bacterium]